MHDGGHKVENLSGEVSRIQMVFIIASIPNYFWNILKYWGFLLMHF